MDHQIQQRVRQQIKACKAIQIEVAELDQQIEKLQQQKSARTNALIQAIGAREALASLLLPEGTTLAEAWREDLNGLRTGG